jgi:multicomponent Na+:H+ antiporter subunit E
VRLLHEIARLARIVWFLAYFTGELVLANARVARDVLHPRYTMTPAIVRITTRCRNDWELTLLANTITMTPGTLTLEVDRATGDLFVHALYVTTREGFQRQIDRLERHLLAMFR